MLPKAKPYSRCMYTVKCLPSELYLSCLIYIVEATREIVHLQIHKNKGKKDLMVFNDHHFIFKMK